jgi:hypothetical protein
MRSYQFSVSGAQLQDIFWGLDGKLAIETDEN